MQTNKMADVEVIADHDQDQEIKQIYWHAVYKLSDLLSPREDIKTEFGNDQGVEEATSKRLTLLSGNMGADEEIQLRSMLLKKISLWFNNDQRESVIVTQEINEIIPNTSTQLYCKGILSKASEELDYLICFLTASKSGLDLFQKDLDKFAMKLIPHLEKYMDSTNTSDYWKDIECWSQKILMFVNDCLQVFDYDLATLLCAGFCGDTVTISDSVPKDVKKNIERFLECCSLSVLFVDSGSDNKLNSSTSLMDLVSLQNPDEIRVSMTSEETYTVTPRKASMFCNDCIKQLKVNQSIDPVQMRQMIENFKLKCIQDMNTFKRLLNQAGVDYYACYKTYLFLLTSGNGLVLMRNSRLHNNMEHTAKRQEVLDTLEQFITKKGGYGSFDTKEQKELLINKMGTLRYN